MLARIDEEQIVLIALVFGFILVMSILQQKAKERRERLRVLEEALRSGNLDDNLRHDLVQEVSGRRISLDGSSSRPSRWLFAAGWLGMCVGGALIAIDDRDTFEAGIVLASVGFGFVSLPIALRELERDRDSHKRRA